MSWKGPPPALCLWLDRGRSGPILDLLELSTGGTENDVN